MQPILAMVQESLNKAEEGVDSRHCPALLSLLAAELGVEAAQIRDLELTLCDTQPGTIWGLSNEFLSSPRLDNQVHCYTGLAALLDHSRDISEDTGVSMLCCFDHEEVTVNSEQQTISIVYYRLALIQLWALAALSCRRRSVGCWAALTRQMKC